jgi:hypothetical protein
MGLVVERNAKVLVGHVLVNEAARNEPGLGRILESEGT